MILNDSIFVRSKYRHSIYSQIKLFRNGTDIKNAGQVCSCCLLSLVVCCFGEFLVCVCVCVCVNDTILLSSLSLTSFMHFNQLLYIKSSIQECYNANASSIQWKSSCCLLWQWSYSASISALYLQTLQVTT